MSSGNKSRGVCEKEGKMRNLAVFLVVGAIFSGLLSGFIAVSNEKNPGDFNGDKSGKVYYMMPTHHVVPAHIPSG